MRKILKDRRYCGLILAVFLMVLFVSVSLFVNSFLHGSPWFIFSSLLRVTFGVMILVLGQKIYGRPIKEILNMRNIGIALLSGIGFAVYLLYYTADLMAGTERITGVISLLFLSKVIFQQITTGFMRNCITDFLLRRDIFTASGLLQDEWHIVWRSF